MVDIGRMRAAGNHIGHQAPVALRVRAWEHYGLPDLRVVPQGSFNFAEFHAIAANFHLMIGTAEMFQATAGRHAAQVARAVEALPRLRSEGIGDEAIRGEIGTVPSNPAPNRRLPRKSRRSRPAA